jgi:hypothetical protein
MASARRRAHTALSIALRDSLPDGLTEHFVGGSHTRRFADNLLPGFSQAQVMALRQQILAGAGGELRPSRSDRRPAHAPYSSAALATNAFGRWLGNERHLRIARLARFAEPLEVESRQRIAHGGGTANLDCLLRNDRVVVGVESKLTETLSPHEPVGWTDPYYGTEMGSLLGDGWRAVLEASREGRWHPKHLAVEQLVKHALALASQFQHRELHLIYVWWEPTNADQIRELHTHRAEIAELSRRVGKSAPRFHALTYAELFAEWSELSTPTWLKEHLAQLHARYTVAI